MKMIFNENEIDFLKVGMEAARCLVLDVEEQREGRHQSDADKTGRKYSRQRKQVKT